jgi:hypothetical protein
MYFMRILPRNSCRSFVLTASLGWLAFGGAARAEEAESQAWLTGAVQPGGVVYGYVDFRGDLERELSRLTADMAKLTAPEDARFRQDYVALARTAGVLQLRGLAYSSVASGAGFENRLALAHEGARQGWLAALGGASRPFALAALAPASTDVLVEIDLDTRKAFEVFLELLTRVDPARAVEFAAERAKGEESALVMEALFSLKGRVGVAITLPRDANGRVDLERGTADVLLRAEGVGRKIRALLERNDYQERRAGELTYWTKFDAEGAAASPSSDVLTAGDAHSDDAVQAATRSADVIYFDGEDVLLTRTLADLQAALARAQGSETLAQSALFKDAFAGLGGVEASSLGYMTPAAYEAVRDLFMGKQNTGSSLERLLRSSTDMDMMAAIFPPVPERPLAVVVRNEADAIVLRAWSQESLKDSLFALGLANPGFAGKLTSMLVRNAYGSHAEDRIYEAQRAPIEARLAQIDAAALRYFAAHPQEQAAISWATLVEFAPELAEFRPLMGESYQDLSIEPGSVSYTLYAKGYREITYERPFTPDMERAIQENLRRYDRAALRYFLKNLTESSTNVSELHEIDSTLAKIMPVYGESYEALYISRDASSLEIDAGGRQIKITRDHALRTAMRREELKRYEAAYARYAPAFMAAQTYFEQNPDEDYIQLESLIEAGLKFTSEPAADEAASDGEANSDGAASGLEATVAAAQEATLSSSSAPNIPLVPSIIDSPVGMVAEVAQPPIPYINFERDSYTLSVTEGGEYVQLRFPLPSEKARTLETNLRTLARAAAPRLAKLAPGQTLLLGELAGEGGELPCLPEPIFDEDYALMQLQPGDTVLSVTLGSGHVVSVPLPR